MAIILRKKVFKKTQIFVHTIENDRVIRGENSQKNVQGFEKIFVDRVRRDVDSVVAVAKNTVHAKKQQFLLQKPIFEQKLTVCEVVSEGVKESTIIPTANPSF